MIAQVIEYAFDKVSRSIDKVISIAHDINEEDVVRQMKGIVPEFISNNSFYESIDEEILTPTLTSQG